MSEQHDPFSPQRVDESIEDLSAAEPAAQMSVEPGARLVRDMQRLYGLERKQYLRALQRVEDRLIARHIPYAEQSTAPLEVEQQRTQQRKHTQGSFPMTDKRREAAPSPQTSIGRRISLLVAVLILVFLVGSLAMVLNYTHHSTTIASKPDNTPTAPPTVEATPAATPSLASQAGLGRIVYTSPTSTDDFYAFAWSPDSKRVALSTNSQVEIRDALSGKLELTFIPSGAGGSVLSLSWSPDGRYLAVASAQVQIINATTGALVHAFPTSIAFSDVSTSPYLSATRPFSGGGNIDYATAWSPDGTLMATSLNGSVYGNVVVVWNVKTGQIVYTFHGQSGQSGPGAGAWSPDGKYVASAGYDNTVQVWNARTGQVIFNHQGGAIFNQQAGGAYIAWAPTGMTLAFPGADKTVQVWNVATNKLLTSRSDPAAGALAWSPDGKEIANASYDTVVIWNATTDNVVYTFPEQGGIYVRALAWSPDGRYIVSGSSNEAGNNHAVVWIAE